MNLAISERILRSDISKYSKCVLVPIFFPNCVSLTKKYLQLIELKYFTYTPFTTVATGKMFFHC